MTSAPFIADDKGNSVAMYAIGLAYANGTGVEKDLANARKMFQQVIDKNDNPDVVKAARQQLGVDTGSLDTMDVKK